MANTHETGRYYEKLAACYLMDRGLTVTECNYRCKAGEIDIIARDGNTLVFVEVKYRKSVRAGDPSEAVDERKQRKIFNSAAWYLRDRGLPQDVKCRFDVIAILDTRPFSSDRSQSPVSWQNFAESPGLQLRWIRNAFGVM